jgi:hypothetical protein
MWGKGRWGGYYYIPVGSVYIQNQIWVWKNIPAYTANPSEKGGKKKNPGINPGQPAGKGREKRKKKNLGINPGQRHLKYTEAGSTIENVEVGSTIECKARIDEAQNMMKHSRELGDFRNELRWW